MLAVLVPRPRQLVLVEDPELHTLDGTVAHGSRADPSVRRHSTGPRTGRPEAAWSPATPAYGRAGLRLAPREVAASRLPTRPDRRLPARVSCYLSASGLDVLSSGVL